MSPALLAALVLGYVLFMRPATAPTTRTGATARTAPAGTYITIPGVGTYSNVYGGSATLQLDPRLTAGLFGAPTQEPEYYPTALTAPQGGYTYVPEVAIDPPLGDLALPVGVCTTEQILSGECY